MFALRRAPSRTGCVDDIVGTSRASPPSPPPSVATVAPELYEAGSNSAVAAISRRCSALAECGTTMVDTAADAFSTLDHPSSALPRSIPSTGTVQVLAARLAFLGITTLFYVIHLAYLAFIALTILFTWQWATDDERTQSTPEFPMRRYWFLTLWVWSTVELAFYLYQQWLARHWQGNSDPPFITRRRRRKLFAHTCDSITDAYAFVRGWFHQAHPTDIGVENGLEWLAWAFFGRPLDQITDQEQVEVHSMLNDYVNTLNISLRTERNHNVNSMRLNLDPMRVLPRPLASYLVISLTHSVCALLLLSLGFRQRCESSVAYWIRKGTPSATESQQTEEPPIVFAHGLTPGFLPYFHFFFSMWRRHAHRTIVILHLGHVAGGFPTRHIPSRTEVVRAAHRIFRRHRLAPAVWSGHSFGSVVCAWISQAPITRKHVHRVVMIDPICFQLWEPDVAYNFFYRKPDGWFTQIVRRVLAAELGVAATIGRNFWWYECVFLPDQVPSGSRVFLAEFDGIIESSKVQRYLEHHRISWHTFAGFRHSQFLAHADAINLVLEAY
ncbi:hypothetical protein THASP1DRAFT_29849 [Thamnocephalis sphaerospora]|uniref:AB hydrolase-1 domain-containing protein n=1 Tax=Thamnocephalis sphaerospora TaxID=78915 RepID=A0A4P9XR08_9FUNG|nr:hypothetical protein THASP1DRAFT_29849 [Thamnocephalis sphaerospora]|eukprot:RKP08352.1 hypothetical protein THASP1DRAFT_29849 [Thamnocephalis sphaerospora]